MSLRDCWQIRVIKDELGENDDDEDDVVALEKKMHDARMPPNVWKHAQRELRYEIINPFNPCNPFNYFQSLSILFNPGQFFLVPNAGRKMVCVNSRLAGLCPNLLWKQMRMTRM